MQSLCANRTRRISKIASRTSKRRVANVFSRYVAKCLDACGSNTSTYKTNRAQTNFCFTCKSLRSFWRWAVTMHIYTTSRVAPWARVLRQLVTLRCRFFPRGLIRRRDDSRGAVSSPPARRSPSSTATESITSVLARVYWAGLSRAYRSGCNVRIGAWQAPRRRSLHNPSTCCFLGANQLCM